MDRQSTAVYETPKNLIDFMVHGIEPKLGETVYDPACGTGGFLTGAFKYIKNEKSNFTPAEYDQLQNHTLYGRELDLLTYQKTLVALSVLGVNSSNIWNGNTLIKQANDPLPKQFDVILTNPPFSSKATQEEQANFKYPSRYVELLFLQHVIDSLKVGGRCSIILPEGVFFRTDGQFRSIKEKLLSECNVEKIVHYDDQVAPSSLVKFSILFFRKGGSTQEVQYAQLLNNAEVFGGKTSYTEIQADKFDLSEPQNLDRNETTVIITEDKSDAQSINRHHIFMSYRREDSAWAAGRIYDYLEHSLGDGHVFRDIESIPVGKRWRKEIETALESCHLLIAVIGKNWAINQNDVNRFSDPNDLVRFEISAALKREIHIFPILIDGVESPKKDSLPDDLQGLVDFQAIEISSKDFKEKVNQLVKQIKKTVYV